LPAGANAPADVPRAHRRAEILVRPFTFEPADDNKLLFSPELDLEPGAGTPARLVDAVPSLGDDALQLLLPRSLQERLPISLDVGREMRHVARFEDAPEERLAILERHVQQRLAIQVEQVEDPVHEWDRRALLTGQGLALRPSSTRGDLQAA